MLDVKDIYKDVEKYLDKKVILKGWIRNHRKQKDFGFISFSDGTCLSHLQLVYKKELEDFSEIEKLKIGACIEVSGKIIESEGKGQAVDLEVEKIVLLGDCPLDYPLQPKDHSREFLRTQAYLRPRANLFQAVFRIRSLTAYAIHSYFHENNYVYLNSPIITANDGEGAGEMFQVTTLPLDKLKGDIDYKKDFFSKKVGLTVTGQLEGEAFAMAFKKTYTFGPTFRAEMSNTKIHAAEFWMIEPEIAFCDLNQLMDIEEEMLKYVIKYLLKNAKDELNFLDRFVEKGLIEKLETLIGKTPERITHKEAIRILKNAKVDFVTKPMDGEDLATEHEKYLTEKHFNGPVFITDWPKKIKAFYMRQNNDGETVAAVDLLVPEAGELMGGSQREERLEVLEKRMDELGIAREGLEWYLNLRKYGGCVHSGFGLGFERLLIYLTGVENIRDVIPFARTYGNCEF